MAYKLVRKLEKLTKTAPSHANFDNMFEAVRHLQDVEVQLDFVKYIKSNAIKGVRDESLKQEERDGYYTLYTRCLLFEAPYLFESYLIYMEINRPYEKKFYMPRAKVLHQLVKHYQDVADGVIKFLGISMPPRTGKLVADYEPVLTSNGWKNHGDLVKGDYVYNHEGDKVKVTHVFDKGVATHRVTFSDKTTVDVHENHEWLVDSRWTRKQEVLETKEMMGRVQYINPNNGKRRYMYQLPHKTPIKGDVKELHVDPYTLGAWLGDGRNGNPDLCGDADDYPIVESVVKAGYPISWETTHKTTGVEYYGFKTLRADLQEYGMCHSRRRVPKYIPEEYLTASVEQRLELLAGLIDTDGTFREKENRYTFVTSEPTLRDSFEQLVSTFGLRVGRVQYEPELSTSGIQGVLPYWAISFNPTMQIPCRLERKRNHKFSKPRKISITNIEPIEETPGNCIEVEGGIYLVGRNMLPTHNSTLGIFYMTWQMGRFPDRPNIMSGHSSPLTQGFYDEATSLITSHEYTWGEIFPNHEFNSSAKYTTIDIGPKRRFSTLTCRAIEATLTGATEADNCLYTDDLVRDLEEAINPERMEGKYDAYINQLKDRMTDQAHQVMVGTRWGIDDPLGRLAEEYADDPSYRFVVMPALNDEGESNFDYEVKGFSTDYYLDMKRSVDAATFMAKYMGRPYSRMNRLFYENDLQFYNGGLNGLTLDDVDEIYAVNDVAWGGGDYYVLVIGYRKDNIMYIQDVFLSKEAKDITRPQVASKLREHKPMITRFEGNNGGHEYADRVREELAKSNTRIVIESKDTKSNSNKISRIIRNSPEIKEFRFRNDENRGPMYDLFMDQLFAFTTDGKSKNDDVPDALAMLAELVVSGLRKVEIFVNRY